MEGDCTVDQCRVSKINVIFVCVLCTIALTPKLGATFPAYISLFIAGLWCVDALFSLKFKISRDGLTLTSIMLLLFVVLYKILGISSAELGNYCTFISIIIIIWMMVYIKTNYSDDQKTFIFNFCNIIMEINVLINIFMFYNLSRFTRWSYVSASKMTEYVKLYNLGSTSFTTAALLFTCINIVMFIVSSKKTKHVICLISGAFYLIVCAGRATNLLLLLAFISLVLVYSKEKTSRMAPLIILFVAIILLAFSDQVLTALANIMPSERIAVRLNAISSFIQDEETNTSYMNRIEIIVLDFQTWLKSPMSFFFGIGDHRYLAGNLSDIYQIGISGHSDYFDFLAKYGILGFTLLNTLFVRLFLFVRQTSEYSRKWASLACCVVLVFVLRSLVGGIFSLNIAYMTFIMLPCSAVVLNEK
jgi:hypothetical protein